MQERSSESTPLHQHSGARLAVAALFASMCAGASAQTPPPPVPVKVTVVPAGEVPPVGGACMPPAGGNKVCVDKDPVRTPGVPVDTPVAIVWTLTTQGWTFVKNQGIDIKNKKSWQLKEDSSTKYTATNKKEKGDPYKYDVNVTDGKTPLKFDPTIMN